MGKRNKNPVNEFRIIVFVLGGGLLFYGGLISLISIIQTKTLYSSELYQDDLFINLNRDGMLLMGKYFPYLIILGLLYILFAWKFSTFYKYKTVILIILGTTGTIWAIIYGIELIPIREQFIENFDNVVNKIPKSIPFMEDYFKFMKNFIGSKYQYTIMIIAGTFVFNGLIFYKLKRLPKEYS